MVWLTPRPGMMVTLGRAVFSLCFAIAAEDRGVETLKSRITWTHFRRDMFAETGRLAAPSRGDSPCRPVRARRARASPGHRTRRRYGAAGAGRARARHRRRRRAADRARRRRAG